MKTRKIYRIHGKTSERATNYFVAMVTTRKYIAKAWLEYWQSRNKGFYYIVEDIDFDIMPIDRPF